MIAKGQKKQVNLFSLNQQNSWLLWVSQLVNVSCLSAEISTWMLVILALCLGWQTWLIKVKYCAKGTNIKAAKNTSKVPSWLLILFAIGGCFAIAINANTLGVLLSMVHLLTFAYLLKTFEIKQRKDFYQLLLLGLFLLASSLIFKQDLFFSLIIFMGLILNLIVLQQIFSPTKTILLSVKLISLLLFQSSLFAIVLFVVFPRVSPFWQVPNAKSAQTGLSEQVSPGDIANLALSSNLAFRADFKGGNIPRYSELYWRAMTLENYDGRKWSREKSSQKVSTPEQPFVPIMSGEYIGYDVIVEPSYQKWLFGLTVATSSDPLIRLLDDYTIQSRNRLSQISYYQVESYLQAPLDLEISDTKKQRNLAIIAGSNPKLEKLALMLKQQYINPIDRSKVVLAWFREKNYFYTLKPPLLINNSLDQFFFETRSGFCVHYASTYTYLMRAAGIPARVVTGYLGGEYNNVGRINTTKQNKQQGGHLSVYQYDAHAWSEIWLEGIGWRRVDPTSAVDPQRVDSGWSNELLAQQSSLNNDFLGLYQFKNIAWINSIRLQFDALDYQWARWVLGYSSKQQYELLKRWFGQNVQWKVVGIIVAMLVIILVLFTLLYRLDFNLFKRVKTQPWLRHYRQVLLKLEKKGLVKPSNISPSLFAQTVAQKLPIISIEFIEFTRIFESLMYKELNEKDREAMLIRLKSQGVLVNALLD